MVFRKVLISIILIFLVSGCNSKDRQQFRKPQTALSTKPSVNTVISNTDEKFYDFFSNFIFDEKFQLSRVKVSKWKSGIFNGSEYIVHIYPERNEGYEELEKDISDSKLFTYLNYNTKKVINFIFKKENNKWFLSSADSLDFNSSESGSFISFLYSFSKDTLFQKNHIRYPLKYNCLIPEKDYTDTTIFMTYDKVSANRNLLDGEQIRFVNQGNILYDKPDKVTIYFTGIDNEDNFRFFFEKIQDCWYLTEETNYSL